MRESERCIYIKREKRGEITWNSEGERITARESAIYIERDREKRGEIDSKRGRKRERGRDWMRKGKEKERERKTER